MIADMTKVAVSILTDAGFAAVAPLFDPRFAVGNPAVTDKSRQDFYTSNWSERHAAYAAGLGTFGLSRGIITEKGISGRLGSVITSAEFPATPRPYKGLYDYCIKCGTCIKHCPVGAISDEGKRHPPCSAFLDKTKEKYKPRYGCGKCQTAVPCERGIPGR
jgi:epoxyqueuosine reductase QueG